MPEDHPVVRAARFLESAGLRHCLIGGYAVAVYGEPRATYDADFLVAASGEEFAALAGATRDRGWEADFRKADLLDPVGDVVRIYRPFACDLLRARPGLEEECLRSPLRVELFGHTVRVVRPELLVLLLLRAGDPRSFYDALGILRVQELAPPGIDREGLRRLAKRYGLARKVGLLLRGQFRWEFRPPQPGKGGAGK